MFDWVQRRLGQPAGYGVGRLSTADFQVGLAAFLAGSGWLFSIQALKELPPLLFIGTRFLLSSILIGFVFGLPKSQSNYIQWRGLLISSIAMAGAMIGWIIGLKHTSHLGVAAFITASGNLVVPFVGFVLFRWPIRRSFGVCFAVSLCGLGFLFLDRQSGFEPSHVLFMGSAILWAVSVALAKNATTSTSSSTIAVVQLAITGVIIIATSLITEDFPVSMPSAGAFGWFSASVLLSTCLRFILQFEGQKGSSPARAALLMIFEPVWAMAFAYLVFGASVSMIQAIGCAIIFAAVAGDALARSAPS